MTRIALIVTLALVTVACGSEAQLADETSPTLQPTTTDVPVDTPPTSRTVDHETTDATEPVDPDFRYSSEIRLPAFATPSGTYYRVSSIIQDLGHDPIGCVGVVLSSRPPQCGGIRLVGLDSFEIPWENTHDDVRFASGIYLEGSFDGDSFVVTLAREATAADQRVDGDSLDLSSPCPEPDGGWSVVDLARVGEGDFDRAIEYANTHPDRSATWVTHLPTDPPSEDIVPDGTIINMAVVQDAPGHEAALRLLWGGPLCVFERPGRAEDLRAIQQEIADEAGELGALIIGADEINQVLDVTVILADPGTVAYFADRWGIGVAELTGTYHPHDG